MWLANMILENLFHFWRSKMIIKIQICWLVGVWVREPGCCSGKKNSLDLTDRNRNFISSQSGNVKKKSLSLSSPSVLEEAKPGWNLLFSYRTFTKVQNVFFGRRLLRTIGFLHIPTVVHYHNLCHDATVYVFTCWYYLNRDERYCSSK